MANITQKSNLSWIEQVVNLVAIISLVFQIARPGISLAAEDMPTTTDTSTIATVLKESVEGRILGNVEPFDMMGTPDLVLARAEVSAYTSTPGQTDDSPFIAANGKRVHDGMIAANGLPFGTKIRIPDVYGDKVFVVEDRMNKRYTFGHFDVWLDTSRKEALKFGRKHVRVEIFYPETQLAVK